MKHMFTPDTKPHFRLVALGSSTQFGRGRGQSGFFNWRIALSVIGETDITGQPAQRRAPLSTMKARFSFLSAQN